jgi:hypothetical protein
VNGHVARIGGGSERRIFPSAASITGSLETSLKRDSMTRVTTLIRSVAGYQGHVVSGNSREMPPNIKDLILPNHREVLMTMSEYEESFRSPQPSLHQALAAARGRKRGRWRSHCFWGSAVLVATEMRNSTYSRRISGRNPSLKRFRRPSGGSRVWMAVYTPPIRHVSTTATSRSSDRPTRRRYFGQCRYPMRS